jgi:hypothetical protein
MRHLLKAIALSAILASFANGGTAGAQAGSNWGGKGVHSEVFQGD